MACKPTGTEYVSMDYTTLSHLRNSHPAWRLLRSDHAPLVTSFLHRVFVAPNVRLGASISRVFMTENKINFLPFPQVKDSVVLFGAGYGFEVLREAQRLARSRIHYWGDIDTHGFAILDQLRSQFGHVTSFLMDRSTLLAFESVWGEVEQKTLRDLPRLDPEERSLHDDLRDNRIRNNLRLEQERIGFDWVHLALAKLC